MAELTPFGQKQIQAAGAQTPAAISALCINILGFSVIVMS
jgi:hypothetical protein